MLWNRRSVGWCLCLTLAVVSLAGQDNDVKARVKGVREYGKGGSEFIPKIEPYLSDPELDVRREAVKAIVARAPPQRALRWREREQQAARSGVG